MGYAGYVPSARPPEALTPLEAALQAVSTVEALEIIGKLVYNCAVTPKEEKFRRIKLTNGKIASAIVSCPGGLPAMHALGWAEDGADPDVLLLPAGTFLTMKEVRAVEAAKEKARKGAEEAVKTARIAASRAVKVSV